ncbi:MAG: hypothetical protein D6712_17845 [Chloroflexi bacterium]|nr:MAG: hypothetical protein D6712_17845 [Chloroflexota bacterium]
MTRTTYHMKKKDAQASIMHICTRDGVNPVDLSSAVGVNVVVKKPDDSIETWDGNGGTPQPAIDTDPTTGKITLTDLYNSVATDSEMDAAGTWSLEFEVEWPSGKERFPKQGTITIIVEDIIV